MNIRLLIATRDYERLGDALKVGAARQGRVEDMHALTRWYSVVTILWGINLLENERMTADLMTCVSNRVRSVVELERRENELANSRKS